MKPRKTLIFSVLIVLMLIITSCYRRIGDLTMISNRNIDSKADYKLIKRNVIGKARYKKGGDPPLDWALDKATESVNGEFLKNAKIFVKLNGKKIKIEGDVWGTGELSVYEEEQAEKKQQKSESKGKGNIFKKSPEEKELAEKKKAEELEQLKATFKADDKVTWRGLDQQMKVGIITGMGSDKAVINTTNKKGEEKMVTIPYSKLTIVK